MSLPTPPSTSHRDKENRFTSGSRVAWSQNNQYHCISSPPRLVAIASASRELPTKSILKKSSHILQSLTEENERQVTPEPADPLVDLNYLAHPVFKIMTTNSSLRDLIGAYSILAARLKACVNGSTDADASWPLFQPFRRNLTAVTDAFIRDLGRALEDPGALDTSIEEICEDKSLLPSPKGTPEKKKKGMTAEQVKHARDLATTCHAVIRLLSVVFTLPAIYRVFSDEQLGAMLTQLLAIPLADELPTPNARKTCALAIWLIQTQRLPSEVLLPARDRIAYALRRGIEGELGKEGKKGSASDGLKAIHDLSIFQPETFVPAFTELLPSMLANLLAPTLTLRAQACHALGGFVLGCTSIPQSTIHTRISSMVASYLTAGMNLSSPTKTPTKPSQDPPIARTLRTTLNATEPQHSAQGPVWALSVIANFIVLVGPALCNDAALTRIMSALLSVAIRHKKSSVRALTCLVWRCVVWAYFQPPLPLDSDQGADEEQNDENINKARQNYWKLVQSLPDMGAGVSTVAALLTEDSNDEQNLRHAFHLLKSMMKRGGQACEDAMEMVKRFVSSDAEPQEPWTMQKLLPPSLFSAMPGLLTVEYKSLVSAVRPIFEQCPQLEDVRPLSQEEIAKDWVFDEIIDIWKQGFRCLQMPDDADPPQEILGIWKGLLATHVTSLQDEQDTHDISNFALRVADVLIDLTHDNNIDMTVKSKDDLTSPSSSPIVKGPKLTKQNQRSKSSLKISILRTLWSITRMVFPPGSLSAAGEKLLGCLMKNEMQFDGDARAEWAVMCAAVLVVCDIGTLQAFWGIRTTAELNRNSLTLTWEMQSLVWENFIEEWKKDGEANWEGAIVLLGVPFINNAACDLDSGDVEKWENLLTNTLNKALDYGVDSATILDRVAECAMKNTSPTSISSTSIADILVSHLDMPDARQIPGTLMDFVNETMLSSYPPEPRNKITTLWMVRSVTRAIEKCPTELLLNLLEIIQEGVSKWISDDHIALTSEEYSFDIVPLYQTILVAVQSLPESEETLQSLSCILEAAFVGRSDKPTGMKEAFEDFWALTYSRMEVPHEGWPTRILTCLGLSPEDSGEADHPCSLVEDSESVEDVKVPSRESETRCVDPSEDKEVSVMLPAPEDNCVTCADSSAVDTFEDTSADRIPPTSDARHVLVTLDLPSTPPKSCPSPRAITPPRPLKSSSLLFFAPRQSPISPHARSCIPTTPVRARLQTGNSSHSIPSPSPPKRRKTEEKENVSPRPIPSILERIAASPASNYASLGKRSVSNDWDEDTRVFKKGKGKAETSRSFDLMASTSPRTKQVGHSLGSTAMLQATWPDDPFTGHCGNRSAVPSPAPSNARKRKRFLLEAVEVLPVREVYRQLRPSKSLNSGLFDCSTPTNRRIRRLPLSAATRRHQSAAGIPMTSTWKPNDTFMPIQLGEPPLSPTVPEMKIPDSDDSIITAPSSDALLEPSSDDDPLIGQVTPHHLTSPAIRRVGLLEGDPPSDDSVVSASPSRDVMTRRLLRQNSLVKLSTLLGQ